MFFYSPQASEWSNNLLKMLSSTTLFNIDNNHKYFFFQQMKIMISEGSCDTEYWINDADNSALIPGIFFFLYIIIENF